MEITIDRIKKYLMNMVLHYQGSALFADLTIYNDGEHVYFPAAFVVDTARTILRTVTTVEEFVDQASTFCEALTLPSLWKQELGIRSEWFVSEVEDEFWTLISFAEGELSDVFLQY